MFRKEIEHKQVICKKLSFLSCSTVGLNCSDSFPREQEPKRKTKGIPKTTSTNQEENAL